MLMAADSADTFKDLLQKFLKTWEQTEPRFIKYFRDHYVNRVEKWAMAFRQFEHKDTDTNMFVEGYVANCVYLCE